MQIVGLVNGNSNNADFQFQTAPTSFINQGVISGLAVTLNQVAVGSALISVTSNGQTWLITFHNTSLVTIDTSGTKKVWIDVTQAKIDNGVANNEDGTGIAQVNTGASYPVSGSYIPLASITSGVITDDRVFISMKGVKRKGMTANRLIYIDTSGNEQELPYGTAGQVLTAVNATTTPIWSSPTIDIHSATQKTTPVAADEVIITDSESSWVTKKASLKDLVIIEGQTSQSSFTGDTDLFIVKQGAGGLRKMTVADTRRGLINGSFNYTNANLIIDPSSGSTNVWQDSSSYATGSNGGGMITALFRHHTNGGSYVSGRVQISDDNSNWTTVWNEQWYESTYYPDYRTVTLVFKAGYVRIGVARDFGYSGGSRINGRAVINLTK